MRWYEEKHPLFIEKDFKVALDSGAHTVYVQQVMGGEVNVAKRFSASYDYAESDDFKAYLESYIEFLHIHKDKYEFYVTLDIIGDPKRSWDITKYIESHGLKPMPVFHYGEDFSWLKKMLDEYDYIGIGGLGQDVTKRRFIPYADKAFSYMSDSKGHPIVKTHGFAMASPEMVAKYPWYTCDASTWTALSRNGTVYIPKPIMKKGEIIDFNFLIPPMSLPVTVRRASHNNHMDHKSPLYQKVIEHWFDMHNYTPEEVKNRYNSRDVLNRSFFWHLQAQAKALYEEKWGYGKGANVLFAGTPSGASTNLHLLVDFTAELNEPEPFWFGSFFYRRHNQNLLDLREKHLEGKDLRELQIRPRRFRSKRTVPFDDTPRVALQGFKFTPIPRPAQKPPKRIRLPLPEVTPKPIERVRLTVEPEVIVVPPIPIIPVESIELKISIPENAAGITDAHTVLNFIRVKLTNIFELLATKHPELILEIKENIREQN